MPHINSVRRNLVSMKNSRILRDLFNDVNDEEWDSGDRPLVRQVFAILLCNAQWAKESWIPERKVPLSKLCGPERNDFACKRRVSFMYSPGRSSSYKSDRRSHRRKRFGQQHSEVHWAPHLYRQEFEEDLHRRTAFIPDTSSALKWPGKWRTAVAQARCALAVLTARQDGWKKDNRLHGPSRRLVRIDGPCKRAVWTSILHCFLLFNK